MQGDHNHPRSTGGATDQANGQLICGGHNRFKHRQRWRTRRADNGQIVNFRSDGTMVLHVGQPPPTFAAADADERRRHGLEYLENLRATWRAA